MSMRKDAKEIKFADRRILLSEMIGMDVAKYVSLDLKILNFDEKQRLDRILNRLTDFSNSIKS